MATRSHIGKMLPDNRVSYVYCHHDGYPEGVGRLLLNYYSTESMLNALLDMGNLTSLGADIGLKNDFKRPNGDFCLFYGRDRGQEGENASNADFEDFVANDNVDYHYLFESGKWRCFKYGAEIDLYEETSW